jgi:hypothetical protein
MPLDAPVITTVLASIFIPPSYRALDRRQPARAAVRTRNPAVACIERRRAARSAPCAGTTGGLAPGDSAESSRTEPSGR